LRESTEVPQPCIQILGVYRVPLGEADLAQAMAMKYPHLTRDTRPWREAEQRVANELQGVVLIEVEITDVDEQFELGDFGQPGSDQAAYDERYLDPSGTQVIAAGLNAPADSNLRVAFFLHYFDPGRPLTTTYGDCVAPPVTEMPARLAAIIKYEPVD
jgi:hypothetical protein